ncbi:Uma2 family endonuclease [Desulfococcaceae bacterium HSG8]|nr:Uma2 family endonuclease [Desulfococcaceae bacterium HSG8]
MEALLRNDHMQPEESPVPEGSISEDGLAISEEEYWKKYYNDPDFVYEWNRGYLEVRPMGDFKASNTYLWFSHILKCYLTTNPVGEIVALDIGFRLALPGGVSVRRPDLSVVMHSNPDAILSNDCTYNGIFDICIESLSYSSLKEIKRDTVDKKKEYRGIGVKEYYILDARGTETVFYRLNKSGRYGKIRPVKGDVIRSQVMPGFQFRISDLYTQPPLEELAVDKIYHSYVFPSYLKVRQLLEQEKQRAEQEKQRAEQAEKLLNFEQKRSEKTEKLLNLEQKRSEKEKQRAEKAEKLLTLEKKKAEKLLIQAEQMATKLRELGISPE